MCMDTYPIDTKMFNEAFIDDDSCLKYLFKVRWPDGYVCPDCRTRGQAWMLGKGKIKCRKCHHVHSVLAGTVFHGTHTPLLTWFRIMWYICLQKNGYSAQGLQRSLGFSYPTAWLCLHNLRKAMVRPGREKLSGIVEVDEAYVGGKGEGRLGRGVSHHADCPLFAPFFWPGQCSWRGGRAPGFFFQIPKNALIFH